MKPNMPDQDSARPLASGSAKQAAIAPLWWAYFPVGLMALMGVMITIVQYTQSVERAQNQVETAFRDVARDRILVVRREIREAVGIVQDIASFFEASKIVERRDFRKFVGPSLKRFPGIRKLVWVPKVSAEDRSAFVASARESFPPFDITETGPSGEPVSAQERPVYYPSLYVQPYGSNKTELGLDLGLDPVASALLREAELAREARISPGIRLDGDAEGEKAIAIAAPVFIESEESDGEGDPSPTDIRGFALGVFLIGDIVELGLANLSLGAIDLHFYQHRADGENELLYRHYSRVRDQTATDLGAETPGLSLDEQIEVGGQQWLVVCNAAPERYQIEFFSSWVILGGGLAFTALLTTYLISLVGRARRVRVEVEQRTSQLQEVVQALSREMLERKSAERELQRLNESLEHHIASRTAEAERKAQYLEQFAYVTSHDLKAPLRAVANLAQWIEEDLDKRLDDSSREQLSLLRDRVRRMNDLIEGLLEYSRVGKTGDAASDVETGELIAEVIDSLSPPKGFKIKVRGEMPTLHADRLQLGQVFSNLLSNSLKHHGDDKGKIRIAVKDRGEMYEFSVCDDGPGIAPEYHDKVFQMFQTLASSDYKNSTGIGLALVKKIVEEHGGKIWIESEPGEGACVYFTWPRHGLD
jgi:signal transduction histidine kinase